MNAPFAAEVARARAVQSRWETTPLAERMKPIRAFRHRLVESVEALTTAIRADVDRTPGEVIPSEFLPTAAAAKFLEKKAPRILKPRRVGRPPFWLLGCKDLVHRRPHGLAAIIGTWNYPLFLNAVPILQAIAAGNAVLWKPSERSPRFAAAFTELLKNVGLPADLIQTLPTNRDAGPQLAEAEIDFLHFTGSETVGRKLAARLGERLIPSVLELSGCDALFVLKSANLKMAAEAAWYGATMNRGRTCMATRRVFVAHSVEKAFRTELDKVLAAYPGRGEIHTDAARTNEASFEPKLTIRPFADVEEALRLNSECLFHLAASIFSNDLEEAQKLAAQLRVGNVVINDCIAPTANPATPFGGRGASGWGSTQGEEGLLAMTTPQTVSVRGGSFRPHVQGELTGDPAAETMMRGSLKMGYAARFADRRRGLTEMIRGMMKFGKKV